MSISANAIWRVSTLGTATNGGFFVTGSSGTDYSQQAAAQLSVTDGVANGSSTITSVTGGFTAAMIGNGVYISLNWYQIITVPNTNTITLDTSVATATALTVNVGGSLTIAGASAAANASNCITTGNIIGVKADGIYQSASELFSPGSSNGPIFVQGYASTLGDGGVPTIQALSGVSTLAGSQRNAWSFDSLKLDGNGYATSLLECAYGGNITNCEFLNFSGVAANTNEGSYIEGCYFHSPNGTGASGTTTNQPVRRCVFVGLQNALSGGQQASAENCIFVNCVNAYYSGNESVNAVNCTFYNATGVAFGYNYTYTTLLCVNCIFALCATAISTLASLYIQYETANAFYSNTTNCSGSTINPADIILTANPFVNPTGTITKLSDAFTNFALNNTPGGGALCRGAGTPAYLDIGAVQHQDSGGAGVPRIVVPRRMW